MLQWITVRVLKPATQRGLVKLLPDMATGGAVALIAAVGVEVGAEGDEDVVRMLVQACVAPRLCRSRRLRPVIVPEHRYRNLFPCRLGLRGPVQLLVIWRM